MAELRKWSCPAPYFPGTINTRARALPSLLASTSLRSWKEAMHMHLKTKSEVNSALLQLWECATETLIYDFVG
jgi:hypothetical protein